MSDTTKYIAVLVEEDIAARTIPAGFLRTASIPNQVIRVTELGNASDYDLYTI